MFGKINFNVKFAVNLRIIYNTFRSTVFWLDNSTDLLKEMKLQNLPWTIPTPDTQEHTTFTLTIEFFFCVNSATIHWPRIVYFMNLWKLF